MATSNANVLSDNFKMPSEMYPPPSLGSEEESFVVLGKSLTPDSDDSPFEDNHEPIGTSVIEEAKQLINNELTAMEEMSLSKAHLTTESSVRIDNSVAEKLQSSLNEQNVKKIQPDSEMEQSAGLPRMPHVNKPFETLNTISITTFPTDLTSEEIQNKISQIMEENIHLKDTILQNNMSMKSQYERIVAWQEDVQKVHQAHKEKIIEAKEFIERLKSENSNIICDLEKLREIKNMQDQELIKLKSALNEKKQQSNETLVRTTDNNIKEFELAIANKKIKELELAMQSMNLENSNLKNDQVKLKENSVTIEKYEKQIEKLQEELNTSKFQIQQLKVELLRADAAEKAKEKSLNEEIQNVKSQLQYVSAVGCVEELAKVRQQLTSTQIKLTEVDHIRAAAYVQIGSQNQQISELKQQIEQMQNQDEMYALQTQLDVYKADFEAERSTKELIKEEKEKLLEDLQNLQRRNQQLQEEIEMVRDNRDYVVYPTQRRDRANRSSSSSNNDSPPLGWTYACPICNLHFRTLRLLEDHVDTCVCHQT